jgi:hypothetical protein
MIKIELKGVKEAIQKFEQNKFAVMKVAAMALNRAAATGKTKSSQMITNEYTMKARSTKDKIQVNKANMRWLQAEIIFNDKSIPLIEFDTKGTGGGRLLGSHVLSGKGERRLRAMSKPVQVRVKKSRGWKKIGRAFRADGRYGEDIFVRIGKARGPLKALRGPSIAGIVKDVVRLQEIKDIIIKRFNDEFSRGMQYAIDKGRIKGGE